MMRPSISLATSFAASIGSIAFAALTIAACVGLPDTSAKTVTTGPSLAFYTANVDEYLGRRCGTLDCHGQVGRPLRLYNQLGLRMDADDSGVVSGMLGTDGHGANTSGTTAAEQLANYEAVIALQPEVMNNVVNNHADPQSLLLLLKPLLKIPHQGGLQMTNEMDPGYECVESWLTTDPDAPLDAPSFNTGACTAAAAIP
jgi:hypothetical protein